MQTIPQWESEFLMISSVISFQCARWKQKRKPDNEKVFEKESLFQIYKFFLAEKSISQEKFQKLRKIYKISIYRKKFKKLKFSI